MGGAGKSRALSIQQGGPLKKLIIAGTAVAAFAFAGVAYAEVIGPVPDTQGVEGCVILGSANGANCTYTPHGGGGLAGHGNFTLTLTKCAVALVNGGCPLSSTGQSQVSSYTLSSTENGEQGCAMWTAAATGAKYLNVLSVQGTVADNQSGVAFGNPFPTDPTGATSGQNTVSSCA